MDKDQLQLRRQVGQLFDMIEETQKLAETTARAQDTRRTALMPGEAIQIMDADGNVAAYFGGSNASGQLIEHVAGPEPKRPSAPELDSPMPGVITVVADGRDEYGEEAQGNHDRVLIHLSHEEGFTPTEATAQHSFFGPEGRQDVSAEPGEWYVAIQWRTKTGQLSDPSEQAFVEVLELVNSADIKATLEESRQRLADAMKDFEEGNNTRKQEIQNINEVVLPALEKSLTDAMTELEERVGDVDLSHLESALAELNETRLPALEETLAGKAESSELPALEGRLTSAFGEGLDAAMTRAGEAEDNAKGHADNLPKVLHGTSAPSGTAPDGSVWWQHQGSLQGAVTAQWNRVDGSWVSTPIDSKAIANLDVGKLTAGGAVISDAVIQDLTASNGAFDRLDAREAWIGNVALEDGAVTARTIDVENVFTNEAVINTLWVDRIQARVAELARAVIAAPNLWPDPDLEQDYSPWWTTKGQFSRYGAGPGSDWTIFTQSAIPVDPSEQYRLTGSLSRVNGDGRMGVYFRMYDENMGYMYAESHTPLSEDGDKVDEIVSLRDGVAYICLQLGSLGVPTDQIIRFEDFKITRALDGSLIVGNSITTRHLVAEAVKAANIDVQSLVADEAFANTVWADVVRAGLLTAEEALIGGALLKDGVIDADKINAESVTAAVAQFLEIEAGMIKANAFEGMTFTGGVFQGGRFETHADPNRGVKMMPSGLVGYNPEGGTSFELNATTGGAVMRSEGGGTHTELSGHGVAISGGWEPYPDPELSDPSLNEARSWTMDGWTNWRMTSAGGANIFPDLRLFNIVFIVTVHSEGEVDVRGHSRAAPENGSASYTAAWDFNDGPGEYQLRMTGSVAIGRDRPYFAWIGLYGDVSMKSMWLEPKDGTDTQVRLSVASDGIRTWDESGMETARFGGGGQNFLAGRLFTNSPGQPGIILDHDRGPDSSQGPGIWFSENGTLDSAQPAIWIKKNADNYYTEMIIRGRLYSNGDRASTTVDGGLNVSGGRLKVSGGGIEAPGELISGNRLVADDYVWAKDRLIVEGVGAFHERATFGKNAKFYDGIYVSGSRSYFHEQAQFEENARFNRWIYATGSPTSTGAANVRYGGTGDYLLKVTSKRSAKVNIETVPRPVYERLLELEPRWWVDRRELEEVHECKDLVSDTEKGPVADAAAIRERLGKAPKLTPGLVAEEVEEAGLAEYAIYDENEDAADGELSGVAYDRLWTLLIPLVREHRDRIEALEAENEALHSKADNLEARLAALEAKLSD